MSAPGRPPPSARLSEGEYLGCDEEGREYFTRGGHVFTLEPSRRRIRGRFAAFNRISIRRGEAGAVAISERTRAAQPPRRAYSGGGWAAAR